MIKIILIILAIFTFSLTTVNAQESASPSALVDDTTYSESVNPTDGISYTIKRIKEKMAMFFAFSDEAKVKNYQKLVDTRLAELKFVVENKKQGYFEKSTQRYFTTAGELTSLLKSKNLKNEFGAARKQFESHIPILTKLRDSYDFGTAEWRFIEDDINYVKGYGNDLQ